MNLNLIHRLTLLAFDVIVESSIFCSCNQTFIFFIGSANTAGVMNNWVYSVTAWKTGLDIPDISLMKKDWTTEGSVLHRE